MTHFREQRTENRKQRENKNISLCLLSSIFCLLFSATGCFQKPYHKEARLMLGTIVEITCQDRAAITSAFEEIKKIETIANNFNPDSEISRLNAAGKIQASQDLYNMVRESLKYYRLSEGAFDITVGPLVSIWKGRIREAEKNVRGLTLPVDSQIKKALSLVSSGKISLDDNASYKSHPIRDVY